MIHQLLNINILLLHFILHLYLLLMLKLFLLFFFLNLAFSAAFNNSTSEISGCECRNEGLCSGTTDHYYCSCPYGYLNNNCDTIGVQITNTHYSAKITNQSSYYFISFNDTTLYYVQISFCPETFHPYRLYYAHIDFQNEDSSINSHASEDAHAFKTQEGQCAVVKYVIFPYKQKLNSQLIRLIVQIRQGYEDSKNESNQASTVLISSIIHEFYDMGEQNITQLLIISTVSSAMLFCITFTVCRRVLARRMRRFVYHPAEIVRDISSFEFTMPSTLYEPNPQISQDEKECMICLLTVQNYYTRTTPCSHLFHKDCIDQWGRKSLTCPACRKNLQPEHIFEMQTTS